MRVQFLGGGKAEPEPPKLVETGATIILFLPFRAPDSNQSGGGFLFLTPAKGGGKDGRGGRGGGAEGDEVIKTLIFQG